MGGALWGGGGASLRAPWHTDLLRTLASLLHAVFSSEKWRAALPLLFPVDCRVFQRALHGGSCSSLVSLVWRCRALLLTSGCCPRGEGGTGRLLLRGSVALTGDGGGGRFIAST